MSQIQVATNSASGSLKPLVVAAGVPILKPLSVEAHSAGGEESQSIMSDYKEYKNNWKNFLIMTRFICLDSLIK